VLPAIEPQKARGKLKESLWTDPDWPAEQKLHGCRYLLYSDGRLLSRHASVKGTGYVDKMDRVPHLKEFAQMLPKNTVLDGELILNQYGTVHDVTSITGSDPEEAIYKQKDRGLLSFVAFDLPVCNTFDLRQREQWQRSQELWELLEHHVYPYVWANPQITRSKKEFYDTILSKGGEGIILKWRYGLYGQHRYWVKAKRSETFDVFVLGYKEASEESTKVDGTTSSTKFADRGWIGSIEMGMWSPADGGFVSVGYCSGIDEATREAISCDREVYLGRVFEIEAQSQFTTGRFEHPRFVRWREDKGKEECMLCLLPE
jgi:ATP-dependent DNA ligase